MLKTEAIKAFLSAKTHPDLADKYDYCMEVQVNVAQDGGERIEGDYHGKRWHGWTDGLTTWKTFRIPFKAMSDPTYEDRPITWAIEEHAEGIGMTGWDWENQLSRWVAYDFDAIVGHSDSHTKKLTREELDAVKKAACDIEWVTVRKSTSGSGLHLYVEFDTPIQTATHTEHAALARSILSMLSAEACHDFSAEVDTCGSNMWVWHRKMLGTDGLSIIKQGVTLTKIPPNWRDHIRVIKGTRRKNLPQEILDRKCEDPFEELVSQRPRVRLDEEHKALIDYLKESDAVWWWDNDNDMLVTHVMWLKKAHEDLSLRGVFDTCSTGSNLNEQNCFCFPGRRGSWTVRRFSPGCREHDSWSQDSAGWTRCFLNKEPDLATASRANGGIEDPKGGFLFREADVAAKAVLALGSDMGVGTALRGRRTKLKKHKDGRLIAEVDRDPNDDASQMPGWLAEKNTWVKIFNVRQEDPTDADTANYDDLVRHLVTTSDTDAGWVIKAEGAWRAEPISNIERALGSLGFTTKDKTSILGSSIFKAWKLVNLPFQSEYPGDRQWNREAARLRFTQSENEERKYPTWLKILNHIGCSLDTAVSNNGWCVANGILNGADYLKCWIAAMFQDPCQPLPYLFLYSQEQNTGKSILHEALSLLFTRGYVRAETALISESGFNEELEGAVLCVVEELDLSSHKVAYNRIKDYVTSRQISVHGKGKTPYHSPNTTHWIQTANNHRYCPIIPGDTRITMAYVAPLDPLEMIPKSKMIQLLEKEAPDFLAEILSIEIPESNDRLRIPVIDSDIKASTATANEEPLEAFLNECCESADGCSIKLSDFYDKFRIWLIKSDINPDDWSKQKISKMMPPHIIKGRDRKTQQFHYGNIAWRDGKREVALGKYRVNPNGYLESYNAH